MEGMKGNVAYALRNCEDEVVGRMDEIGEAEGGVAVGFIAVGRNSFTLSEFGSYALYERRCVHTWSCLVTREDLHTGSEPGLP